MLKILIADDEPKVCKLITKLVETSEVETQIVGVVHDGVSAIEFLKEQRVDLLLTDIRMPGYTGLELIKNAREMQNDIRIIIISGYGQFDYAQEAIKYGVDDYLLKPLKRLELNGALKNIVRQQEKRQEREEERNYMLERITKDDKREKGEIFRRYLERPDEFSIKESEEIFEHAFGYRGGAERYQTFIVRVLLPYEKSNDRNVRRRVLFKGVEIIRKNLQKNERNILVAVKDADIYCVMSGKKDELSQGIGYLRKIKIDIIRLAEIIPGLKVWIAAGTCVCNISEIIQSIQSAEEALLGRFLDRSAEILTLQESTADSADRDFGWNMEKERFLNNMEVLDIDGIRTEFEELERKVNDCQNLTGNQVKKLYRNVITTFRFGLHRFDIDLPAQIEKGTPEQRFERSSTIEEVFSELSHYIVEGLKEWENLKNVNGGEKKQILKAKQYINKFYYMPLTLEEVSDYVGFNASYFSSIFKKEMKQSFSEYLTDIRIRYAKQMILNEDVGITEVSERVGYNDKKYFAKVFKKNTGLTPHEYKKIYR